MWDLFISHASEDKDEIARPLAMKLKDIGLKVWYDEFSLTLGDSLRESIDKGLSESRFGVVIFSKNFFSKDWPKNELNGLFAREKGTCIILPIWHKINESDIIKYSPILADRVAVNSSKGLDKIIEEILKVINPKSDYLSSGERILEVKKAHSPNKTIKIIDRGYYPEMVEDYLLELDIQNYSINTINTYKSILNNFYKVLQQEEYPYDDKKLLKAFKKYIIDLKRDHNISQNYFALITGVIKKFFEFNNIDALKGFETPKRIEAVPRPLSKQEVKNLINVFDKKSDYNSKNAEVMNLRNKIILTLIYSYGLKTSELIRLRINNIDFNDKIIILGENEKDRKITFDEEIKVLMEKYIEKRDYDSDFLFISRLGNHLTDRSIRDIVKKHAKEANIKKDVNPSILRYSFEDHHLNINDIETLKSIYDNAKSI